MKSLILAPYIFIDGHKHAARNKSGLAYMIRDIADMIATQNEEVFVLTQAVFTSKLAVGDFTMLTRKKINLFKGFKTPYLKYAYQIIRNGHFSYTKKLRIVLYFLTGGYTESVLKELKPDVVHINSIGLYTLPFILACVRTDTKFILTLHGLISFSDSIETSEFEKNLEKEYLNLAKNAGISTTVISSGIKKRIERWQKGNVDYISVVLNSVKTNEKYKNVIEKKKNKKMILCVGSLSTWKNQIQVVRAFELLKNRIDEGYRLLLVGDGEKQVEIEEYIQRYTLTEVELLGRITRDEVMKLYEEASLVVMASIDEGFGLPMIEAYSCGAPTVAFADLDAIPDIYSPDTMVLVRERTDVALAEGIDKALDITWDPNKIKAFSNRFSPDNIGKQYCQVLSSCRKNNVTVTDIDTMIKKAVSGSVMI